MINDLSTTPDNKIKSDLATKALSFFDEHRININSGIVVAVSGGVDSVVMLEVLSKLNCRLAIAHCNFQLRDEESMQDEQFVSLLAKQLNVPFHVKRFNTQQIADENKQSIQAVARDLRYNWFEELRKQLGFTYIATAHHANDNAETILQHIIEGTGLAGLRGIPAVNGNVIRPFINVTKDEILNYASTNNIKYRTDSSNLKTDYTRNKIRLDVLPKLLELNPSLIETLNANAHHWRQAHEIYHQGVSKIKKKITSQLNDIVKVNIAALRNHQATETILFELLKDYGFNTVQAAEVFESLDTIPGKQFLSNTHRVIKDREQLIISKIEVTTFHQLIEKASGVYELPNGKLEIETISNSNKINFDSTHYQYLDGDQIQFPLIVRPWQTGDYFYPFGLNKKKKLSDYFSDKKMSLVNKERQPLLQSANHIVTLPGLTIDHRFQVKPTTKKVLKIRFVRND